MGKIKLALLMLVISIGVKVNAYDYNQILTEYNGGIIGSLNNCGVNLSANPKYLRGAGSISLQSPGTEYLSITKLGEAGVVSVTKATNVFYSPDGLHLSGGGNTISLGKMPTSLWEFWTMNHAAGVGMWTGQNLTAKKVFSVEVKDENKVLLFAPFERSDDVLMVVSSSEAQHVSLNEGTSFIGYAHGKIYQQKNTGEIYTYQSIDDLLNYNPERYIETSTKNIEAIKSFNSGVLTLADGSLYYSEDMNKLLSGGGIENKYSSHNGSIANMEVIPNEEILTFNINGNEILIPTKKDNVILAHGDGKISWDGEVVIKPVNIDALKSYLVQSLGLSSGARLVKSDMLNYNDSVKYGSGTFVGASVNDATMAIAVGLNGLPATVNIEDKGWTNWEYKYRSKGKRTGAFNHEYGGEIIGDNKMKVIASHSCTAVVSVTDTNLTPFEYNTSLDASFGNISSYSSNNVLPGLPLGINTGWTAMDWYLTACEWVGDNIDKVGLSVDSEDYGCTPNPEAWRPTVFDPKGGTQFSIVNDQIVWVR